MPKQVIIFIAPPGAGKGTQAEEIVKQSGHVHIETSKLGEQKINDEKLLAVDAETRQARENFLKGELYPTPWIIRIILDEIKTLAHQKNGVIFSGSPRRLVEAETIMPEIEKLYGKENIVVFYITLSEEESVKRNSARRICEVNRHPIPSGEYDSKFKDITVCPWDGSPIITRALDKPEVIRERYRVYKAETEPVLDYLREHGYKVIEINGEQPIEKVTEDMLKHLSR